MGKNERTRPDYVVLEEEIEDNYQPTQEELSEYAEWLGMILPRDKDLLWIAHEGLTKPLAKEWKPCRTEDDEIYYFNFETGESRWDHPCDEVHRNLLRAELERLGRPLAKQRQIEPSYSSQCKSRDNTDDRQRKATHEEKAGSEIIASISQPSEMHPSGKGGADSRTHEQTHDANGSRKARVSEKLAMSKRAEVKETFAAWKLKKGTDEVVGFTSGSKEEEDREMNFQRGQMMDNVKKEIEEETSIVLQQARRAMQERVDMVIKEEETGLLADKRVKMLDVVEKQMEVEKETEVATRRGKLKIELDEKMEGERDQMVEEQRTKMFNEVAKQIQEEHAAEVMRRKKVHCDQKFQTEVANKDVKAEEKRQMRKCSKRKEEYENDCGGEGLLCLKLDEQQEELDKKLGVLDSASGKLQDSRDHMLHCDLCNSTVLEKREFACTLKEKLKLEELKLYDKLKKKMVIHVREIISGLERRMSEEEHRLTKTKLRDRINWLFEEFMQETEIQLLRETGSLLREKGKVMRRGLGSSRALEIPVAASFEDNAAVKEWRSADDEDNDDEIEYLWSNKELSQSVQLDKLEKAANVLSRRYSGGSFGAMENPFSLHSSILPPTRWRPQSEGETNMRAENIWSRSKSSASRVAADRLEPMDGIDSTAITPDLKILRRQIEETFKDLMEQFRTELRKDLLSLRENKEVGYLPLADRQESARVLELPKDLLCSLEGWRSEFGKEMRDQVQQYKDELENKFLTLKREVKEELKVLLTLKNVSEVGKELNQVQHYKDELENKFLILKSQVKEELKVLLTFKDVILQNLRRTEQESRSKFMIHENENLCQHLVDPHGKTIRVDAADRPDFAQVGHFSVHVVLGAKKSKLSKLDQWISESQAPTESKIIPDHPQAKRHQVCGKEKTTENAELVSLANFEEKLLPNSLRFANEYDWTRTQRRSRLDHSITQKETSNLQTERLNKALQKYMKWIIQHISSGRKRADTICSKCGLAMRQTVRRLDSGWTIVAALIEKSKRECKSGRYKRTHTFHTNFGSDDSSRQNRSFDRSLRIGVDGWEAPQKLDHKRLKTPRGSSLPRNLGYDKSVSDFHLALCPQENEDKMRWLYSSSELKELRDLWNMDADYANPTTKQHQDHAQVQASREWTERADDDSIFQLTEDTDSKLTITDTISRRETSSMSMERLGRLDMLELEDAVAMFRQSRESPHIDSKSMEQALKTDSEQQRSNEVLKARAIQDEVEKESEHLQTELLQLRSQPWTLKMAPEIEEVEDRAPGFITLEFAIPREDDFAFQGMQVNRNQHNSTSNLHRATQTIWHI